MEGRRSMKSRLPAKAFEIFIAILSLLLDVVCSTGAIVLAFQIRFKMVSPGVIEPPHETYLALAAIFTILNVYFLYISGLYRPLRGFSRIDVVFQVIKSCTISLAILLAITFFYRDYEYSRLTIMYSALISYMLVSFGRMILMAFERGMLRRGHGVKKVMVVGTGSGFNNVAERFSSRSDLGYRIIGYLEESPSKALAPIPLLGTVGEIEGIIVTEDINALIVTLEPENHKQMKDIVDLCDRRGLECLLSPDMIELLVGPRFYEEICSVPLIRVKGLRIKGFNAIVKRSMDIVLGTIGSIILSPFLTIIATAIKMESRGPVFYMQKRVGMDGNIFWMYKFRSMRPDAEAEDGPTWSQHVDTRVTTLGNILRKLSIDELPQIINVIKGDMSLIGPRPERPYFVEQFEKGIPRYMERHKVKSGMSGWAQVNGLRGDTSIPERLQYDLYYIENWSVWFDLKIIILTFVDIIKSIKDTFLNPNRVKINNI
jgi:exopolysaccharide biosynthesis polyprenyl glycosylphosphotransferase